MIDVYKYINNYRNLINTIWETYMDHEYFCLFQFDATKFFITVHCISIFIYEYKVFY
jgi:hypothetical protein